MELARRTRRATDSGGGGAAGTAGTAGTETPRQARREWRERDETIEEQQKEEIRRLKRKLDEALDRESKLKRNDKMHFTVMKSKEFKVRRMEKSIEMTNRKMLALESRLKDMEDIYDSLEAENKILADCVEHYYDTRECAEIDKAEAEGNLNKEKKRYRDLEERIREIDNGEEYMGIIEKERKRTAFYRKKMLELAGQLQIEKQEETEEVPQWKMCEICDREYSEEADQIPRVLSCGHTVCTHCAGKMVDDDEVRCPFCRAWTELSNGEATSLPKNFAVIQM